MRLVRLQIDRLPGIADAFALIDLAPGVNVVLGPNTSGKSSIARAFTALVTNDDEGSSASLAAELADRTGALHVERRHAPRARWMRNGERVEPPAVLEPELLHGLVIRAEDLASAESRNGLGAGLAARIERELAGGFDLASVRALGQLRERQQAGRPERAELTAVRDDLRRVEQAQRALKLREDSLDELRERCVAAREAAAELADVKLALELLDRERAVRTAAAQLERFPAGLARIPSDTPTRLATVEKRLETARGRQRDVRAALVLAEADLEKAGLGAADIGNEALSELQTRLTELREHEKQLSDAATHERAAVARLEQVRGAMGDRRSDGRQLLRVEEVEEALAALDALAPLRAEQAAVTQLLDGLPHEKSNAERLRDLRRGLEALDAWLQAPRKHERGSKDRRATAMFVVLAAAGVLGVAAAEHPLVRGAAVALIALGAWLRFGAARFAKDEDIDDSAERARTSFESVRVEPPDAWEPDAVRTRREGLALELAEDERRRNGYQQRLECERKLERVDSEIDKLLASLEPLAQRLGFDARRLDVSRLRWNDLVRQHDEALVRLADAEAAREALEDTCATSGAAIADGLRPFAELDAGTRDPHTLATALRSLEKRVALRDDARRRSEGARRELESLQEHIRDAEKDWAQLFELAEVVVGDRAELLRRVERAPDYGRADRALQDARALARGAAENLHERPDLLARVEAEDEVALKEASAELTELAGERETLSEEIVRIETELKAARSGHALSEAHDRVRRVERKLETCVEEQLVAAAGQFWLDRVEKLHRRERTGALKRAERWFARFTHDAFALEVRHGKELRLEATDQRSGEPRTLEQLSTATRVQLLLAVRLAFLEEAEKGRDPLPLFLDEVLSTSDPERSEKIIDAVAELARDGRQVFYLTAQPDEAARWRAALGDEVCVHDLAAIRRLSGAATLAELVPPPRITVQRPDGRTPEVYAAALGVPELDPWREDATHVYHVLCDELELLHKVLEARYESLGPLGALLEDSRADVLLSKDELATLHVRVAVARTLFGAWREGRGRPMELATLSACPAITDTFQEQVLELAEECEFDARQLIAHMNDGAVARFKKRKLEELTDWLTEAGHLVDGEPLPHSELRLRALATARSIGPECHDVARRVTEHLLSHLD